MERWLLDEHDWETVNSCSFVAKIFYGCLDFLLIKESRIFTVTRVIAVFVIFIKKISEIFFEAVVVREVVFLYRLPVKRVSNF